MSVLVILKSNGEIWFGSDSRQSIGSDLYDYVGPKFKVKNGITFGSVGYGVYNQIIDKCIGIYNCDTLDADSANIIFKQFGSMLRELREDNPELGKEDAMSWPVIYLANDKKAFRLSLGAGCEELTEGKFWTDGSGREISAGALYAAQIMHPQKWLINGIVEIAVKAACEKVSSCGGNIHVSRA